MVFQSYALYPHMTVAENIGFHLKVKKMKKKDRRRRVEEAARILDLHELLDRKPANLSGGQRQRVAMGRAIVREPQVFLMDEPLSNLDAKLRVQTRTQIAALQRELGVTTVYVTHDQTEAMTTIDVNTGGYVGHRNLEETIYRTNLEAAMAIARQLRLRNLGGIIIIDFIDMTDEDHKRQVIRALERCLAHDHAKTHISEVSTLGLVEMTRKRTRESLEHVLCEGCPTCGGRGMLKTAETTCFDIFRDILREWRQFDVEQLLVLASQEVVDLLLDEESQNLAELEQFIGRPIKLQAEELYSQEQYDVVLI